MVDAAIKFEGLKELRKGLKQADAELPKQLTSAQRDIAKWVASESTGAAKGIGGSTGHFASQVKGRATAAGARIEVGPKANAAFWGAKKRTGWNAGNQGRPQHPAWVGSGWEPGGAGGPYAINETIRSNLKRIEEEFLDAVDEATRAAFPTGG